MAVLTAETKRFLDAWMQVRQIVQASNFNRFQREGLSATQFMTLNVVPEAGMTLSELARRLNLGTATLNGTVNSLEERGLVNRERDLVDARKVFIRLTPSGSEMQNAASSEFHGFMEGLLAKMEVKARAGLVAGLEQLVALSEPGRVGEDATRRGADAARGSRSARRVPRL